MIFWTGERFFHYLIWNDRKSMIRRMDRRKKIMNRLYLSNWPGFLSIALCYEFVVRLKLFLFLYLSQFCATIRDCMVRTLVLFIFSRFVFLHSVIIVVSEGNFPFFFRSVHLFYVENDKRCSLSNGWNFENDRCTHWQHGGTWDTFKSLFLLFGIWEMYWFRRFVSNRFRFFFFFLWK